MMKTWWVLLMVACNGPTTRSAYDIEYVDDLTIPQIGVDGLLLVVNRGATPLDLSTAAVVSFEVLPPQKTAAWAFLKSGESQQVLQAGHAAGFMLKATKERFEVDRLPVVPVDDLDLNFTMTFLETPPLDTVIYTQAVIRIGGTDSALFFKIHTGDVIFNHATNTEARF